VILDSEHHDGPNSAENGFRIIAADTELQLDRKIFDRKKKNLELMQTNNKQQTTNNKQQTQQTTNNKQQTTNTSS
jgi:hypothetical protein